MQLYLPLAELSINIFLLLALGLGVGFIAGLFGVGGGFLLTPLIILIGVPPAIAVGSVTAQIAASSTSGALSYWRRGAVDVTLALWLLLGSFIGSFLGVLLFSYLKRTGNLDLTIALGFTVLLGFIGFSMLKESATTLFGKKSPLVALKKQKRGVFALLPFKFRFKKSRLYLSILPIIAIGFGIGLLGAVLGIGGGFLLVPALIYILRVPTHLVLGTTMFLTLVTMAITVILQAGLNQSVDILLALPLIVGGVIGAQFGTRLGFIIKGEWLRFLLSLLLLAVAFKFLTGLILTPNELFILSRTGS